MKILIQRRPIAQMEEVGFLIVVALLGLLVLASYAVHALHGTLAPGWFHAVWGSSAGLAVQMFKDPHFQKQWFRLLRLRITSVHVQRWIVGHFQWMAVWAALWSLAILWVAPLCGYSLMQAGSLIGLSLLGLPLYGLAGLAWEGYGSRLLRGGSLAAAAGYFVWHYHFGWLAWGLEQGIWLTVLTLALALAGMWGLMRLMMRLGEPAFVFGSPTWTWRQWFLQAWVYIRGRGGWIGLPWLAYFAIQPWTQLLLTHSQRELGPTPYFRLFAFLALLIGILRSDRHHWRYQLMPRLRLRQAWAYEIWASTLRWVLTLTLPLLVLGLFVWQGRTGMAWPEMLQAQGHWLRWWAAELAVAGALAVYVRTIWKRWPQVLSIVLTILSLYLLMGPAHTDSHFWAHRHVGHDLLLLLAGWVFLALANRNLQRYGLPDWGQSSPSWGRAPEPT